MQLTDLPPGARRLFPEWEGEAGGPAIEAAGADLVIPRLLEDGDGTDLAWLFATLGRERVRAWFAARGGRRLSRRSRLFWQRVLAAEPAPPHPLHDELWPL